MKALNKLVDFVLPPRCIVSGEIVDEQGMLSPESWSKLSFISDPQCQKCGIPFDFDDGLSHSTCASCLKEPPPFNKARSALIYNDESRDLILAFKHGDKTHYVAGFMPWLKRAGDELFKEADLIIPVPLHRWRLLQRRYNQSGIISKFLAKELNIPVLLGGLIRVRATPTQGHLKVKDRKKNVRRAFSIQPSNLQYIKDKKIVLIDDVFTTGATVNECTKVLLSAGAKEVNVLTLARVVKPTNISL